MTAPTRDPHRLLSGLCRDGVSLEISTLDVCFLAALQLRAEQDSLASFEEDMVFDIFDQVCDPRRAWCREPRKRATHTIQRLRSQRMLARVDAAGIVSAGEYALTSLATVIVKSFLEDEQLTRESLALLTGAVSRASVKSAPLHSVPATKPPGVPRSLRLCGSLSVTSSVGSRGVNAALMASKRKCNARLASSCKPTGLVR